MLRGSLEIAALVCVRKLLEILSDLSSHTVYQERAAIVFESLAILRGLWPCCLSDLSSEEPYCRCRLDQQTSNSCKVSCLRRYILPCGGDNCAVVSVLVACVLALGRTNLSHARFTGADGDAEAEDIAELGQICLLQLGLGPPAGQVTTT